MSDNELFVLNNNPFRWKSYYYDIDTSLYYINGRYYYPYLMMYLDADNPEVLITNAYEINGLDRHTITLDNCIDFVPNQCNIFTASELYPDPTYDPDASKSWWELNWKKAIQWIIFGLVLLTSLILMLTPAFSLGFGMFTAGLKCAISGFIIGGVVGGIVSAIQGNSFLEGACEGAIYGAINGFSTGAIMYAVSQGINTIINTSNKSICPNNKCFIAGTLVLTYEGYKAIEDIKIGDKVASYDEATGKKGYKEVVRLFRNTTNQTYNFGTN